MEEVFPRLLKAPIAEALIDFRVRSRQPIELQQLARICEAVSGDYSIRKDNKHLQLKLSVGPDNQPHQSSSAEQIGYRLEDPVRQFVLQVTRLGFTISKLPPYSSWEQLEEEAQKTWTAVVSELPEIEITRSAVRYINRIELPGPEVDFDLYLTAGPKVPGELPQAIGGYMTRLVIPLPDLGAVALLTQALDDNNTSPSSVPVVLDIDVFVQRVLPVRSDECWVLLRTLRYQKNRFFFKSLTARTIDLLR